MFNTLHFKAILLRRWILIKRSVKTMVISVVGTLIFSLLAIVCQYLCVAFIKEQNEPITFNSLYRIDNGSLAVVVPPALSAQAQPFINNLVELFKEEKGFEPYVNNFTTGDELNSFLFELSKDKTKENFVLLGLEFISIAPLKIKTYYNSTWSGAKILVNTQSRKVIWKTLLGEQPTFYSVSLQARLLDMIFGQMGPMLIVCGLISITPLLISQPITDITGEVRPYMMSCTLTHIPYWLATFLVDFLLWLIVVTVAWAIFLAAQIVAFLDNIFNSWYTMAFGGPSLIFFCYCLSFLFNSPESASRQAFLILIVLLLIPMLVSIIRNKADPIWLTWVYSFIPHIALQRAMTSVFTYIGANSHTIDWYWHEESTNPYMIMQWLDIVLYVFILWLIESVRLRVQRNKVKRSFGNYTQFFEEQKAKHPITEEAKEMEEEVANSHDYAVRIEKASRLFFNTAGDPISAVNCVSLGVKQNSIFGFLGANGAGKTTLIKMITSLLPVSDGTIEIDGINIDDNKDPTIISICPQFNSHLCDEMTPDEHFKIYSMLFQLPPDEAAEKSEHLIQVMELADFRDKPIRELSGGDVRKLAIALSFLGPAKIILLDEPTASLDPVAQHKTHEMILQYKGQKTFMLCTHLLSEAEALCDMISIMIKGCVYTCGPPQYLSAKFGTEFKIDVLLADETEDSQQKLNKFFESHLPTAQLSIQRPSARIYSVPATDTTLHDLFVTMENGMTDDNGFVYYTCSSSSLERVFMEIVRISENEDMTFCLP